MRENLTACSVEPRTLYKQLRHKSTERARAAVEERLGFETLLAQFSTQFLNLPPSEVDRQIAQGLQRLAEFLKVDRSSLFAFSEDKTHFLASHSWTAASYVPAPALLAFDQFPWAIKKLLRGEIFLFSHVSDLPAEARRDKESLRKWGSKSAVVIPLAVAGSIAGAVSFAALGTPRAWSEGLVRRLRLVGEIFSNALSRKQADASLHTAFAEIQTLQQQLQAENLSLRDEIDEVDEIEEIKKEHNVAGIIGQSDVLKSVLFRAEQVAPSDTNVLLLCR